MYKEPSANEMLKFITEANNVDCYDVRELYLKSFAKVMTDKTGVYFSTDKYNVCMYIQPSYKLDTDNSIDNNVIKLAQYFKEKNTSIEEIQLYSQLHNLFSSYYFSIRDKENNLFSYSVSGLSSLIYFLRYLVNNTIDNDLKETNEFMEVNNLGYNCSKFKFTLGNLTVERFINGNVYIKGLTPQQWATIERFSELRNLLR